MQLFVLGREPHLSLAELESRAGSIEQILPHIAISSSDTQVAMGDLGGTLKIANIVEADVPSERLSQLCAELLAQAATRLELASVDFGVSCYGFSKFNNLNLLKNIKKELKGMDVKSRFVLASKNELSAAQIIHNKLLTKGGEIILVSQGKNTTVALTTGVQDIESYSFRDYTRPARDSKVGMFPPKLAQIMISLAQLEAHDIVYDPFCGSGVVLQETLLQNHDVWGSDNAPDMVAASKKNIEWLTREYDLSKTTKIFLADALTATSYPSKSYVIITEGYLGPTYSQPLSDAQYSSTASSIGALYTGFLSHIVKQPRPPRRIIITLPFWKTQDGIKYLNIVDQIQAMGYTIKQFESVKETILSYKRADQIVGRQILVLEAK